MKSAVLFAVAAAGLAAAQAGLEGQPACATPCLTSAISAVCTPATDQACACASQSEIGGQAASCLLSNCNAGDLAQAQSAGSAQCVSFSATASETGSASASASATGTSSGNASVTSFTSSSAGASATGTNATSASSGSSATGTESSTRTSTRTSSSSESSSASGSAASASSTAGAAFASPAVSGGLLSGFLAVAAALL